jgi:hypothetical protein
LWYNYTNSIFYINRSEEDYFYEEEEDNASLSPEVEPEYRSHRSRNHPPKRYRQRMPNEKYLMFLFKIFFININY